MVVIVLLQLMIKLTGNCLINNNNNNNEHLPAVPFEKKNVYKSPKKMYSNSLPGIHFKPSPGETRGISGIPIKSLQGGPKNYIVY